MGSITTEGVILKRKNFGEADRVVTIITKQYGKISVVAKGVRRITSRRAGNIEVLNRVKLHLFKAKSFNLQEAEAIQVYPQIKENLTLVATAFHVVELVDRMVAEDQFNPLVYSLVVAILELLEKNPRQIFLRAFEVKLLSVSGFWSINALPHLPKGMIKLLEQLEHLSWNQINELSLSEEEALFLENILRQYIERVLEANLKSIQVMRQLRK